MLVICFNQVRLKGVWKEPEIQIGLWKSIALNDLLLNQMSLYGITCTTVQSAASCMKNCWLFLQTLSYPPVATLKLLQI